MRSGLGCGQETHRVRLVGLRTVTGERELDGYGDSVGITRNLEGAGDGAPASSEKRRSTNLARREARIRRADAPILFSEFSLQKTWGGHYAPCIPRLRRFL